jgi:hypothetical protein
MSRLLQYERNIEEAVSNYINLNGLKSSRTTETENLGINNIQVKVDYAGALNEFRQLLKSKQEYDTHNAVISVDVSTYREKNNDNHNNRIGKLRKLFLNSNNGLEIYGYTIFDIYPSGTTTLADEESNADISTLSYEIKFKINLALL